MATPSPLARWHTQAHATLLAFGAASQNIDPVDAARAGAGGDAPGPIDVVATFGELEVEYAAIRTRCALLDAPQRAVAEVTGPDRMDFLNRMLTQELRPGGKALPPWRHVPSFWLNRKGRVDADVRVVVLPERVLLETDTISLPVLVSTLSSFIIMEECAVRGLGQETHRISLHGPRAGVLLGEVVRVEPGAPEVGVLSAGEATRGWVSGAKSEHQLGVTVWRTDDAGAAGYELLTSARDAEGVVRAIVMAGHDATHAESTAGRVSAGSQGDIALPVVQGRHGKHGLVFAGWLAYNIARIEAGTALFHIDFGRESLPAETGVFASRVSVTKGCYLGQEVVARMYARGAGKQKLVSVKWAAVAPQADQPVASGVGAGSLTETSSAAAQVPYPLLPERGSPVFASADELAAPVGGVTSSTLSPMLGMAPIALVQVRSEHATPGTVLTTRVDGVAIAGVVQGELSFLSGARGSVNADSR